MATIPTPATTTVGQVLTSAIWNAQVRDAVSFLINPPRARIRQTVTQTLTTGTWTSLLLDTEDIDTDALHSTTANTSRATIATPGTYLLTGTVAFASNTTGGRYLRFAQNGVGLPGRASATIVGSGVAELALSTIVAAAAGDYLEVQGFQSSGGNLATSYLSPDTACRFELLWVGV